MAAVLRDHARAQAMSRSTLWRVLDEADLKPHRCVYWLNSHDPEFDAKARDICTLYVNALRFFQQGRLVICVDEKTGMQILQRKYPTQPAQPGSCPSSVRVNTRGLPGDHHWGKKARPASHHGVTAALCTVMTPSQLAVQAHVATSGPLPLSFPITAGSYLR